MLADYISVTSTEEVKTSWCSDHFNFANLLRQRVAEGTATGGCESGDPEPSSTQVPHTTSQGTSHSSGSTVPEDLGIIGSKRRNREKKRKRKENLPEDAQMRKRLHFLNRSRPFRIQSFRVELAPHAQSGYIGLQDRGMEYRYESSPGMTRLQILLSNGYTEIDPPAGTEVPLTDANGLIYGVVVGRPPGWSERVAGLNSACKDLIDKAGHSIPSAGRRGDFGALSFGFSYGGGQTAPCNITHVPVVSTALATLQDDPHVRAVFQYMEGPFSTWFPKLQEHYEACLSDLQCRRPDLRRPAPRCSFAASTLNVGPQTVCRAHRDSNNIACGICVDYAFGDFDGTKGGHLVLHEPRLIIRLHAGSAVLFPSAVITHENIPIAAGEERMSLTMYTAGGLARFREQGYQTQTQFKRTQPSAAAVLEKGGERRWTDGWGMFMTMEDLYTYWTPEGTPGMSTVESGLES